jgi:deoxyribonuclease-4
MRNRFGAHLSVAGGLHRAFDAAVATGCDCMQIFVKNQRQWQARPLSAEQIRAFRAAGQQTGVAPVVAHASYLLNLASPRAVGRRRSIAALVNELRRCAALGVPYLVVHPGAHLGDGIAAGIRRIAASLDDVHARTPGCATMILLETTAGQGTTIGHEFAHLAAIISAVKEPPRVGVCLDTCHLFAAGYNLADAADYARTIDELDRLVGLDRVRCIHVNDSKHPCGSRKDRHEHITKGCLGRAAFARLIADPRLAAVPKIIETPKGEDSRGRDLDRVNLRRLRSMIPGRELHSYRRVRSARQSRDREGAVVSRERGTASSRARR